MTDDGSPRSVASTDPSKSAHIRTVLFSSRLRLLPSTCLSNDRSREFGSKRRHIEVVRPLIESGVFFAENRFQYTLVHRLERNRSVCRVVD
ncbi:hypothetical protein C8039_08840 [Halogeometricum sp. wsp3]|nr:hypothetical protein C8039_08840 [Halogeometricum sp. wsp3]